MSGKICDLCECQGTEHDLKTDSNGVTEMCDKCGHIFCSVEPNSQCQFCKKLRSESKLLREVEKLESLPKESSAKLEFDDDLFFVDAILYRDTLLSRQLDDEVMGKHVIDDQSIWTPSIGKRTSLVDYL
ncbi:hypothetical protein ADUPG1_012667 [Aduncisulcus paluster]|uniref:TRIP4/RQT4 C2HC5-type zinc finger domain-containing protein n=1 Tax=Aduncisulcus paluster TaxID=2918883 RepID=A0ABQ5K084_9EUKA|nr:hypothetical protein ADUPG1_012667 [Aduncisulcus paluster]|eukprot:gnl/Carplike_NY0171/1902_a2578_912.p1 GENE.gnl/Carplike_NY0171/1902_a2578_912~~gnl/Carplike_NY0171/1902_a2578_912.p1  ORF type:complete len:129 (+),score=23.70 gnl/Carplike_NY0171/1902_a2578_912:35-421(+)